MKTPRERRRSEPTKAARHARRSTARAVKAREVAEKLHRLVDGPGRMTPEGWLLDPATTSGANLDRLGAIVGVDRNT